METQPDNFLVELIRYNNWANAQVIAVCQKLADDQLAASASGAYGTIRDTLEHMIRAEADYIGRLTGNRPQPAFKWREQAALADIAAFADEVGVKFLEVVQRVPPTHIVREEENGLFVEYLAQVLFMQVIIHGIEHRTNITTIANSVGVPTPEVDSWGYSWSLPEKFMVKEGSI